MFSFGIFFFFCARFKWESKTIKCGLAQKRCIKTFIKEACKLVPQPSSSEPSVQSLRPSQRCSLGMHIRFRQVQSDSKQSCAGEQFSSSEPLGHWICPSQRADRPTQPKESRQGKWFRGHFDESGGKQEESWIQTKRLPLLQEPCQSRGVLIQWPVQSSSSDPSIQSPSPSHFHTLGIQSLSSHCHWFWRQPCNWPEKTGWGNGEGGWRLIQHSQTSLGNHIRRNLKLDPASLKKKKKIPSQTNYLTDKWQNICPGLWRWFALNDALKDYQNTSNPHRTQHRRGWSQAKSPLLLHSRREKLAIRTFYQWCWQRHTHEPPAAIYRTVRRTHGLKTINS